MFTITQLRALNLDKLDVEDAVAALVSAEAILGGFTRSQLSVPEWLDDKASRLRIEIAARRRDDLARRLKLLKSEAVSDRTPEQRRADRASQIAHLESLLTPGTGA